MTDAELAAATEILPDRLYYVSLHGKLPAETTRNAHFFSMDNELIYWNFFLDFGPLNLAQLYRFCQRLNSKLKSESLRDKIIYYYCGLHAHKRTNAALLMAAWSMIYLDRSPKEAFEPFRKVSSSFPPFHDASPCLCTYPLSILDCLKGIAKARFYNFFDFCRFNVEEYEHFEQVENGDLNWIVQGKFLAFAGPQNNRELSPEGYYTLTPENYAGYFLKRNVQLVIRLNKKYYDETKFTSLGIKHLELYYLDGSIPTNAILQTFLKACEETPGAIAVHCKAGLGRTGTCIACYLMKHYRFTAAEAIGWLRVCRPGSIIGPQQHYLEEMEQVMWRQGDAYRQEKVREAKSEQNERDNGVEAYRTSRKGLGSKPVADAAGKVDDASIAEVFEDASDEWKEQKGGSGAFGRDECADGIPSNVVPATAELSSPCLPGYGGADGCKINANHFSNISKQDSYMTSQGDSLLHRRAMVQQEQHRMSSAT